jgi:hypothetical protein
MRLYRVAEILKMIGNLDCFERYGQQSIILFCYRRMYTNYKTAEFSRSVIPICVLKHLLVEKFTKSNGNRGKMVY